MSIEQLEKYISNGKLTLTVIETAALLGLSRNGAYNACNKGEIPCIRFGHTIRIPTAKLKQLLDSAIMPIAPIQPSPRRIQVPKITISPRINVDTYNRIRDAAQSNDTTIGRLVSNILDEWAMQRASNGEKGA